MWIPYTRHVTNVEVRATTGCRPLSHLVTDRRLRIFGHIDRSSPQDDYHRAVAAVIRGCLQVGSDRQEDLATPGFVQWRQTLPTEHWPCICLEKCSYSWRLTAHCGHRNAPAEYAIKEEEEGFISWLLGFVDRYILGLVVISLMYITCT